MERGMLITCPEHDDATSYLSYFSRDIIDEATAKLLKVKKITDEKLNEKDFSQILKKLDYNLIILNGHGSADSVFGFKNNIILQVGRNESLLAERLVYARSCNAGLILGPACMKNNKNGCFIGYSLPFVFYMDEKWSTKPSNDKVAALFIQPSNLIPISFIKGNSALEAHSNSKKQILKAMKKLMEGKPEDETPFYLEALWNNYSGQVIIGNESAKIYL